MNSDYYLSEDEITELREDFKSAMLEGRNMFTREVVVQDRCNETMKVYKTVPKRYKSSFNKLTLVSNEYKVYCEPVYLENADSLGDVDIDLVRQWLVEQIDKKVFETLLRGY